jgi:hypothetical protein
MKITAFILLVSFASYFTEIIQIPLFLNESPSKTLRCSKMKIDNCMKMRNKGKSDKGNSHNCNGITCLDCPLCYISIPVYYNNNVIVHIQSKKTYSTSKSNWISFYTSDVWKPPKVA